MKIIQRGTAPSERTFNHTCGCCRSKLEFTTADGKVERTAWKGDVLNVACPVCGTNVEVTIKAPVEVPRYTLSCGTQPHARGDWTLGNSTDMRL